MKLQPQLPQSFEIRADVPLRSGTAWTSPDGVQARNEAKGGVNRRPGVGEPCGSFGEVGKKGNLMMGVGCRIDGEDVGYMLIIWLYIISLVKFGRVRSFKTFRWKRYEKTMTWDKTEI